MAAHAVGDGVQRELVVAQEAVLVVVPLATDVGCSPADDSHLRPLTIYARSGGGWLSGRGGLPAPGLGGRAPATGGGAGAAAVPGAGAAARRPRHR